jgi:hypothetical protein
MHANSGPISSPLPPFAAQASAATSAHIALPDARFQVVKRPSRPPAQGGLVTSTWDPAGAGVLRLPSGRLVGGRSLRRAPAFKQNIRRGHYELATDVPALHRARQAFDQLTMTI